MDNKAMWMRCPLLARSKQSLAGPLPSRPGTPGPRGSSRSLRCFLEPENVVHRGGRQAQRLENSALAVRGPLGCAVRFYYSLEAAGFLGGGASKVGGEMRDKSDSGSQKVPPSAARLKTSFPPLRRCCGLIWLEGLTAKKTEFQRSRSC